MLALFALLCGLAGCAPAPRDFGITIRGIEARPGPAGHSLVVRQRIVLSPEARDALQHGVPLVFEVEGRLRQPGAHTDAARVSRRFEIRYLPLSSHYQLIADGEHPLGTYPRLRHALADLNEIDLPLPGGRVSAGDWEARARCRLLERALPRPMRLPAWLSAGWRHDSGWTEEAVHLRRPA